MQRWYVATCKPGINGLNRAIANLSNLKFITFSPMMMVEKKNVNGEISTDLEPVFPGYIFIKFDIEIQSAGLINNCRGVSRLLTFGQKIIGVPEEVIESLEIKFGSMEFLDKRVPEQGDEVRIMEGPFTGLDAVLEEPIGERRSMLMVEFLGTRRKIEVSNRSFV